MHDPDPAVIETGLSPAGHRQVIQACEYQLARNPLSEQDRRDLIEALSLLGATEKLHGWHLRRIGRRRANRRREVRETTDALRRVAG